MTEQVKAELSKKEPSLFHKKLLEHCKSLVLISRNKMSQYYAGWDNRHSVYKGERPEDLEDKKAKAKGEPKKIAVPMTYAQIQTFISFAMGLLRQKQTFYEIDPTGSEDVASAKIAEALLERDLQYNDFTALLYQYLLDISRFGVGVIKHTWVEEKESVWVKESRPVQSSNVLQVFGRAFGMTAQMEEVDVKVERTKFKGNKLSAVSPYHFYPDTRLPLSRYQEGEFCASESEVSRKALKKGEQSGMYAGVDHVSEISQGDVANRKSSRFDNFTKSGTNAATQYGAKKSNKLGTTVILTEVQVELIPSEFELENGEKMGDSDEVEKWVVVYANDDRIIRAEPLGYEHNRYTYTVSQFSHDQQELMSETIADMIGHLQSLMDWFINSHVSNVRKHVQNRVVVNPKDVYMEDLRDHKPVIRVKPSASGKPLDRVLKQLQVSDVTAGHVSDASALAQFMNIVTSINDNMLGQFNSGRRSAREAGNVNHGSGSRLRMIVSIIYDIGLKHLGEDMLSNLRDGLDEETYVEVVGLNEADLEAYSHFTLKSGAPKVGVDRTKISGRYDFKMFEGTLPSEKHQQAETLEQTLLSMFNAGAEGIQIMTQVLGYDPQKLFKEVLELRGVKHSDRLKIDEVRKQQIQQEQVQQQQIENGINQQPDSGGILPAPPQGSGGGLASLVG